jgi:hypothetical protein
VSEEAFAALPPVAVVAVVLVVAVVVGIVVVFEALPLLLQLMLLLLLLIFSAMVALKLLTKEGATAGENREFNWSAFLFFRVLPPAVLGVAVALLLPPLPPTPQVLLRTIPTLIFNGGDGRMLFRLIVAAAAWLAGACRAARKHPSMSVPTKYRFSASFNRCTPSIFLL